MTNFPSAQKRSPCCPHLKHAPGDTPDQGCEVSLERPRHGAATTELHPVCHEFAVGKPRTTPRGEVAKRTTATTSSRPGSSKPDASKYEASGGARHPRRPPPRPRPFPRPWRQTSPAEPLLTPWKQLLPSLRATRLPAFQPRTSREPSPNVRTLPRETLRVGGSRRKREETTKSVLEIPTPLLLSQLLGACDELQRSRPTRI